MVSIVGILSAIAFPQYRRTLVLAEASTSVQESISFAQRCALAHKAGLPVAVVQPFTGFSTNCNGTVTRQISSRRWSDDATGVLCLGVQASVNDRQARLDVTPDGTMSCSFLP